MTQFDIAVNFLEPESLKLHAIIQGHSTSGSGEEDFSLRNLLRDDSVISVKLYSKSFLSFLSNYLQKNILPTLKYIKIESMFGKNKHL